MSRKEANRSDFRSGESEGRKKTHGDIRRGVFHSGDILLVCLAVLLIALLILIGSVVLPAIRENFREYNESLLFTVEFPLEAGEELPKIGDGWVLLDSDGAVCTVRAVEYLEDEALCHVTLLRKNTVYREGEGYSIGETRVAVGTTLFFRRDIDRYFAASVTALESDRFLPQTEETSEAAHTGSVFESNKNASTTEFGDNDAEKGGNHV